MLKKKKRIEGDDGLDILVLDVFILQIACHIVTALLHLFFMASFSWMLVEGLLLWSKVVSVNISEDSRMKLYYVIGWGNHACFANVKCVQQYNLCFYCRKRIHWT